jgi:hypothetical protein
VRATREQLRQRLEGRAQEAIEEILDWGEQTPAPTLSQLEEKVLELRERLGVEMVEVLMSGQEATQPATEPRCGGCGDKLRFKGRKARVVETRLGALRLERGYYHCVRCQGGLFPPRHST